MGVTHDTHLAARAGQARCASLRANWGEHAAVNEPARIPRSLRAVAWVQFALGVIAFVAAPIDWAGARRFEIAPAAVGIPVCFGLLGLHAWWRTCCLALLWLEFALALTVFPFTLGGWGFDPVIATATALFFLLTVWQIRVMTSPEVRRLFIEASPENEHAESDR